MAGKQTTNPLPVAGYTPQSAEQIDLVNENKRLEEQVLRVIDRLGSQPSIDQRSLAVARTNVEQAFMWLNRAVFKPERIKLTDLE